MKTSSNKYFLASIPLFCFLICYFYFDFNGLYGQDAHEYLRYSKALLVQFQQSISPGDYNWPILYPWIAAAVAYPMHIEPLLVLQLISVVAFSLSILVFYSWIKTTHENAKYLFVFVLINFLLAPMLLRNSQVVMSESVCMLFIILCFYAYHRLQSKIDLLWLTTMLVAAILAVSTRYVAALLVALPIIFIFIECIRKKEKLKFLFSFGIAMIFLLPHLVYKGNSGNFLSHIWLTNWDFKNFFSLHFDTLEGVAHYHFVNIIFVFAANFHPIFSIFLLPVLFFTKKIHFNLSKEKQIIFWSYLIYTLFLAGIPYQNKRFFSLGFPLLLILLFPIFQYAIEKLKSKAHRNIVLITIVFFQLIFCFYYLQEFMALNKIQRELAAMLERKGVQALYSFDVDMAIKSYNKNITTLNLWEKQYSSYVIGNYVLFNEAKFTKQWNDKNPMINWNKIKGEYKLTEIETASNGWKLFRIDGKINN